MMSVSFASVLLMPALFLMSNFGLHIPNPAPADPAADEARFNSVNEQLDMGGTVYAYVSVDGDLSAIGSFVESKLNQIRQLDERAKIPPVDIPQLLTVSGLDAVSAMGISSKRTAEGGFRNKAYIYAPNTRQGFLRILGDESKPFDVVNMAPAGTDVAIEQDVNLKVAYEVAEEVMGMLNGDQGKAMLQAMVKRPAGPFPFTLEKILADLDTQVTIILDADPSWTVNLPGTKIAEIPQLNLAITVDGLGWVVEEMANTVETKFQEKGGRDKPPVAIVRGSDWAGLRIEELPGGRNRNVAWIQLLSTIGGSKPVFLHHKPTGKMVLATGKEFAAKLFQNKPNLASDPVYHKTMDGLPTEGTSLAYVSPELFKMFRETFSKITADERIRGKEMFMIKTMLDLIFPEGLQGEGSVTTSTKEGILTVSNSSSSHKSKLAGPLTTGLPFILMMSKPTRVYDHYREPHVHEGHSHGHEDHHDHDHEHEHDHAEGHKHDKHGADHGHGASRESRGTEASVEKRREK